MSDRRRARLAIMIGGVGLVAAIGAVSRWRDNHALLINASRSLPNWAFFVDRSLAPAKGDLIFFVPPQSDLLARHFGRHQGSFGKRIMGVGGDRVTRRGRIFLINGRPVARAKAVSRRGDRLELGPTGTIPPGCYFVATPHPDSFDSRYAHIGWICRSRIIGVGRAIL